MRSIGYKITVISVLPVLISLLILGGVSSVTTYISARAMAEHNMLSTAEIAASRVEWEINAYSNISQDLGTTDRLIGNRSFDKDKIITLERRAEQFGLVLCNLIKEDGVDLYGADHSTKKYFQEAMKGNTYISAPFISPDTGDLTIIVAAPLWKNGNAGTEPVGCVYVVPNEEFLNDIIRSIKVSENGTAYMIDSEGNTVADTDSADVLNGENIEKLALSDSSLSAKAEIHKQSHSDEKNFTSYRDGKEMLVSYARVGSTDGWTLVIEAPATDFLSDAYFGIFLTLVILAAAAAVSAAISVFVGKKIGGTIKSATSRIEQLAEGDLTGPVAEVKTNDETEILSSAAKTVVDSLNGIIGDMGRILEAMSYGDLGVDTGAGREYYTGDFEKLLLHVRTINERLNATMEKIDQSADKVSGSASLVASEAQALSGGAAQQAMSIEQLASAINTISEDISENYSNCTDASKIVGETTVFINAANSDMIRLTEAMRNINETSGKIGNIIKTIEDIAFQTNILALNASVEAARAGAAGKGFAVVAGEVRNLANSSAKAASTTAELIEQSIEAVQKGADITAATAASMNSVGEHAANVEKIVKNISDASHRQADMIDKIKKEMDQISSIVRDTNETAEKSAAASEELSGQSAMLKELMGKFKLHNQNR